MSVFDFYSAFIDKYSSQFCVGCQKQVLHDKMSKPEGEQGEWGLLAYAHKRPCLVGDVCTQPVCYEILEI